MTTLLTDNIAHVAAQLQQQLSSAAFTVVRPLTRSDSAQVDFMLLADPDGFLVELQQDRREMYRK